MKTRIIVLSIFAIFSQYSYADIIDADTLDGFEKASKTLEVIDKTSEVAGFIIKNNFDPDKTGVEAAGKAINAVGKAAAAANVTTTLATDMSKIDRSGGGEVGQAIASVGNVGLAVMDTVGIFVQPLGEGSEILSSISATASVCADGKNTCETIKHLAGAMSNPLGEITGMARTVRDGYYTLGEELESQNESEESYDKNMKKIEEGWEKNGIWSLKQNEKVLASKTAQEFQKNANEALDNQIRVIDLALSNSKDHLDLINKYIDDANNAPFLFSLGKKTKLETYEYSKNMTENHIHRLNKIKDQIQSSRDSYIQEYKKRWLETQNFQPQNQIALQHLAGKIQGNTSHFGSVDYYFNSFNRVSAYTNRQRETIQENPYLAAGSRIVEAPADIVLNWGARPADLDSHLTGPVDASGRERFHTFYTNRGSLDAAPNALLYRDDTSHGVGRENLPEQTRINVTQPGVYNFYVHDYSNMHQTGSMEMSNSGARVSLHSAGNRELPEGRNLGTKVAEYGIPTNREGTAWHVFELDTRRNVITPVNTLYNVSDPTKVPVK